jgi:ABC-type multidrug transport system ATPase subunit
VSLTSSNYVIEARNLTKSYGRGQVLKGIDLQVEPGTMVALLGPNSAGKTRIVRILSTLLSFDGATVRVDGHNVRTEAGKVRAVIGLTGQATAVDELLTGRENLVLMGQLYRLTSASARVRAQKCAGGQAARSYTWCRPPSTGRDRTGPLPARSTGTGVSRRSVRCGRSRL